MGQKLVLLVLVHATPELREVLFLGAPDSKSLGFDKTTENEGDALEEQASEQLKNEPGISQELLQKASDKKQVALMTRFRSLLQQSLRRY